MVNKEKRVMIVDGYNLFVRSYVISPQISKNGNPIGGVSGTLMSLQKLMRQTKADEVVIVFDGPGGSRKKRTILKEYKEGRKPPKRLNRNIQNLNEDEEKNNQIWQQIRLFEYLNHLPVIQLLEPEIEADDLISLVSKHTKYSTWNKVIVSSDKDFIQLCDEKTVLFRPIQDEVKTYKTIVAEYGIHPNNFALARSIDGDVSDNIKGVPGVGLKTIAKYLPFLSEERSYMINEVVDFCSERINEKNKIKFFSSIVAHEELIKTNYSLTQLYSPNLSVQTSQKARYILDNFEPELNQTSFRKLMAEDGLNNTFDEMFATFRRFVRDYE